MPMVPLSRRRFLTLPSLSAATLAASAGAGSVEGTAGTAHAASSPMGPRPLQFPRDYGAHPEAAIEWWYVTGHLSSVPETDAVARPVQPDRTDTADYRPAYGFQLTFFRVRLPRADALRDHPSRLAAPQLLFAHAALTDLSTRTLHHAQRLARWRGPERSPAPGNPDASDRRAIHRPRAAQGAALHDTQVWIEGWELERHGDSEGSAPARPGTYQAGWSDIESGLRAQLSLQATQPLLLQGAEGWSRKSPEPQHTSYYYTQPQLQVSGLLHWKGATRRVTGRAWMDHEWSHSLLHPQAQGWDWVGLNLDDGSALTVFRLRRADGSALWAGGSFRRPGAAVRAFASKDVRWIPGRIWRSPTTGASYPVEWTIESPAGRHRVQALVDAQELDSRASTGTVYWEGLSAVEDLDLAARPRIGWGYLEMTGYAGRLAL